jgi:hypothetical protein
MQLDRLIRLIKYNVARIIVAPIIPKNLKMPSFNQIPTIPPGLGAFR